MNGRKTEWTEQKLRYLINNIDKKTNKQLAGYFGFTLTVVRNKIYELGLQRCRVTKWTEQERQIVRELYKTHGDTYIASVVGKTNKGVRKQRYLMNLHRTVDEIREIVERNMEVFKKTSFKPGNKPQNNPAKAWDTRRKRDAMPAEQIVKRIERREKCNFYR